MSVFQCPARFNFPRDVVEQQHGPALMFVGRGGTSRRITFEEISARTAQWTSLLRRRGVAQGDRVLVLVGKTPDWHPIMLATLKVGAVAIPCSEMLRARDLSFRARHSGASLLVADPLGRTEIEAMEEAPPVVYTDEADLDQEDRDAAETSADDPAFILYTSGTTKEPKGVVGSHALLIT